MLREDGERFGDQIPGFSRMFGKGLKQEPSESIELLDGSPRVRNLCHNTTRGA